LKISKKRNNLLFLLLFSYIEFKKNDFLHLAEKTKSFLRANKKIWYSNNTKIKVYGSTLVVVRTTKFSEDYNLSSYCIE